MSEPGADPRDPRDPAQAPPADARPGAPLAPRPLIERIGLAAVAIFVGGLFTLMAGAAWVGEEGFLAVMAGLGGVMTLWAGLSTLRRG